MYMTHLLKPPSAKTFVFRMKFPLLKHSSLFFPLLYSLYAYVLCTVH